MSNVYVPKLYDRTSISGIFDGYGDRHSGMQTLHGPAPTPYQEPPTPYHKLPDRYDIDSENARLEMIAMRLRIPQGQKWPFDYVNTAVGNEKIFVFIVQDDQPVILEDSKALFPSDVLITQLRLIQK